MASGRYDAVLLMEGTNDLGDRDAAVEPAVLDGLHNMVSDAKSRGVRVFLATLPPMNPKGFRGLAWSLIPGFNDQIRSLAASEGVTLVDVFQALNSDVDTMVGPDGLHLSAAGYLKTADTFMAAIKANAEVPTGQTATFSLRGRSSTAQQVR
jgi:lysophospholipase L1-like esterase